MQIPFPSDESTSLVIESSTAEQIAKLLEVGQEATHRFIAEGELTSGDALAEDAREKDPYSDEPEWADFIQLDDLRIAAEAIGEADEFERKFARGYATDGPIADVLVAITN